MRYHFSASFALHARHMKLVPSNLYGVTGTEPPLSKRGHNRYYATIIVLWTMSSYEGDVLHGIFFCIVQFSIELRPFTTICCLVTQCGLQL